MRGRRLRRGRRLPYNARPMRLYLQQRPSGGEAPKYVQLTLEQDLFGGWFLVRESGTTGAKATVRREHHVDFGVIESDGAGFLAAYREKPVLDYTVSMGVYVLSRQCQALIRPGESLGMPDLLLRVLAGGGHVYCAQEPCYWLDIGRVDDYEEAQRQFQTNPQRFLPGHAA